MLGIYGANGFIGRHLARTLASQGVPFKAVSRRFDEDFSSEIGKAAELVVARLGDPIGIASSLQGVDTVVQLISTSSPGLQNNHSVADIQDNVIPHVEFLQSCVQAGVRRYIFVSSGGTVYGPGTGAPFQETDPTNPICSHGLTKLTVEKYIQMHGHVDGLEYVILRLANPFGPGQQFRKGQGLIPAILDRHHKRQPVLIFGDGLARRDYIYIDDVIDAIQTAVALPEKLQSILNIGSGETRSAMEIIRAIEEMVGRKFELEHVKARKTDVNISSLDITAAGQILGWQPRSTFHDGIRRTVEAWN